MKSRVLLVLFSVLVLSVAAYAIMDGSDDSDAATADNVRVFIERVDGTYSETVSSGTGVQQIIEKACKNLGMKLSYNRLGIVTSVDGVYPSGDDYWNIHQWMPLGNHDWASVSFDAVSDSQVITGTTYCLHMSSIERVNGVNVYGTPDFKPESDGYVFIRFDTDYDSTSPLVQDAFTVDDRISGFWIKGHGSNMGEVVKDAMESNGFEADFLIQTDSNGNDLQYWVTSFFGISGDTKIGENSYIYWSQYIYLDDKWSYNSWTLGYYDPAVYRYVGMVYIVSMNYTDGAGEETNVLATLPDVTDEASVASKVRKSFQEVVFMSDGEVQPVTLPGGNVVEKQLVRYGKTVPYHPADPVPPAGMAFRGWGDYTQPVYGDTVFEAIFEPLGDYTVTYRGHEGGTFKVSKIYAGGPADLSPVVEWTEEGYYHNWKGWSIDRINVLEDGYIPSGDAILYPLYDSGRVIVTISFVVDDLPFGDPIQTYYGTRGEDVDTGPDPESTEYRRFTGWDGMPEVLTGDVVLRAVFDIFHRVEYRSDDGVLIHSEMVGDGVPVSYSEVPEKPRTDAEIFTFAGWYSGSEPFDPLSPVTEDLVLVARFDSTVRTYSVRFLLDDAPYPDESYSLAVAYGGTVSGGDIPVVDVPYGKKLTGWEDVPGTEITGDTAFRAYLSDLDRYVVRYFVDGALSGTEQVFQGYPALNAPVAEKAPTADTVYSFLFWSAYAGAEFDLSSIDESIDLNAVFKASARTYTVTFQFGDEILACVETVYNGDVSDRVPELSVPEGMKLTGWEEACEPVTSDMVLNGRFEPIMYTVEYRDHSGTVLHTEQVRHGDTASYGETPSRSPSVSTVYSFRCWIDGSGDYDMVLSVTSDLVLRADYTETARCYSVTFLLDDVPYPGASYVLSVAYGSKVASGDIPAVEIPYGKKLVGWEDVAATPITRDTVFPAYLADLNMHTVRYFVDGILAGVEYVYNGYPAISAPVAEKSPAVDTVYSFLYWSAYGGTEFDLSSITENIDLDAVFKGSVRLYTVEFVFADEVVASVSSEYGGDISDKVPVIVVPEGMKLVGWEAAYEPVTSDMVLRGSLEYIIYTVEFRDHSDKVIYTEQVRYGDSVTFAETPSMSPSVSTAYTFRCWIDGSEDYDTDSPVTSDLVLRADYSEQPRQYAVSFVLDGEDAAAVSLPYGAVVTADAVPEVQVPAGMVLTGWEDAPGTVVVGDTVFHAYVSELKKHTIRYFSGGELVGAVQVYDGYAVQDPPVPARSPTDDTVFTFRYWSVDMVSGFDFGSITGNADLYAVFDSSPRMYTVSFVFGDEVLAYAETTYGGDVSESIPQITVPEGMKLVGWEAAYEPVMSDMILLGSFEYIVYSVEYRDHADRVVFTEDVCYGDCVTYAETPSGPSTVSTVYTFRCWTDGSEDYDTDSPVTSDLVLRAGYNESTREYTVRFTLGGTEIRSMSLPYGDIILAGYAPEAQAPEGRVITGWDGIGTAVTGDTECRAVLVEVFTCTVSYHGPGGALIFTEEVAYGGSAKYAGTPYRESTVSTDYTFAGWSTTSDGEPVDLGSVRDNLDLVPVYDESPRMYQVIFYGDGGQVSGRLPVPYGSPLDDVPAGPERESTVDKVYTFAGWAVAPWVGTYMDGGLLADLSCITSTVTVFPAYTYTAHPYVLTIRVDGMPDITYDVVYGGFLSEDMMSATLDGHLLRFYRDPAMTKELGTSYMFSGDTVLYAQKVAGSYTYADDSKTSVIVDITTSDISELEHEGDEYLVADISGFADGKSVIIGKQVISRLGNNLDEDAFIAVELHRGRISVSLSGLATVMGLKSGPVAGISDDAVEFSISKVPSSSVRINSSLKNVSWDESYNVVVKVGGRTLSGPSAEDVKVRVTVPYEYDGTVSPMVWSANANTGVLTSIPCTYSDGTLTFEASSLRYYFTGTSGPRGSETDDRDYCPYGEVDYSTYGSDSATYHSTLNRMDIDCHGDVLMVPSSLEGFPVWGIGPGAFSGVVNAPALVIPASVRSFDWSSLYAVQIGEVYFLGDCPEFAGEAPAHVSVYYSDKASGWSSTPYGILNVSVYSMRGFSLQYALVDGQVVIVKWVSGEEVDIPAYVNVNGTEYPVTIIGCSAFEDSSVRYVRIPDTVREVQTRAFYHCSSLEGLTWGSSPSVRVLADECFRGCEKLRSTTSTIPDGTRFIGFEAFRDCRMVRSLVIPNTVDDIRGGAFYLCTELEDVVLSDGISVIPERCFAYCGRLDGVIIPDSVTVIGHSAFYRCGVLTAVNLNNAGEVGYGAFSECGNLLTVTFGKSLKVLGRDCFAGSLMLAEVSAYCVQPEGYASCGLVPEAVLYANYDVADEWTAVHEVIEKEDDLKRSFEAESMPYVVGAIIIVLVCLALASVSYRRRNLL